MTMNLKHRVSSLERWGLREARDFQPEAVRYVRDAGYTGICANGSSGFGPDMLLPESLAITEELPDLMPLTAKANQQQWRQRCDLLRQFGIKPWLCVWGVAGPDQSSGGPQAPSNKLFDRRTKLEMTAMMQREPEIFGYRNPRGLSWRGNRPLCLSHPRVQRYYEQLYRGIAQNNPDLEGVVFFPGDGAEPESCDEHCPRCKASGEDSWAKMLRLVNKSYQAMREVNPDIAFYFVIWNQDHADGAQYIRRFLDELDSGIGIAMSISDNDVEQRKSGPFKYNQPWSTFAQIGDLFKMTADIAHEQGRPLMAMGEISQSEVWDPACHNMPTPRTAVDFLSNANATPGTDALFDFWGNRSPWVNHANHAVMRCWLDSPEEDTDAILRRAAAMHYSLADDDARLDQAVAVWAAWTQALREWALWSWNQRFSWAIGRESGRGGLYAPLTPPNFPRFESRYKRMCKDRVPAAELLQMTRTDRDRWYEVAAQFHQLSRSLEETAAMQAEREGWTIMLAAELIESIARALAVGEVVAQDKTQSLRPMILDELDTRQRQLEIGGKLGFGSGVDPCYAEEDMQNMRLYLSLDSFPEADHELFSVTESPYSA